MGGFKSNAKAWLAEESRVLDRTEQIMLGVAHTRSDMLAPHESGALESNGRVVKNPEGGHSLIYGDESVPYARRRHFENKKNPQTLNYLKRGGDSVAKENIKKYVDMSR